MSILKTLSTLFRNTRPQNIKRNALHFEGCRTLFSAPALGVDGFEQQRQRTKTQLSNIETKFRTKMSEYVADNSKNIIFTEDLKNMIYLADSNDIDLVISMMKRFNSQNKELRFGNFIFGPVVMRMFYVLDKPDEALACYKSPELDGFFDQLMTHQVLFDLLYENQKYKEMLELYNVVKSKQIDTLKWSRSLIILVMAACYKLNTEESLQYALKMWTDVTQVGHIPSRRAVTFCAALALRQGKPDICLEILSTLKNQSYMTVRNLKVLTFIQLQRVDDIIPIFKSILNEEVVQTFNHDVIEAARSFLEKENNSELMAEFNHVMKYFKEHGNISEDTLDMQLCSVINKQKVPERFNQDRNRSRIPRSNVENKNPFYTRRVSLSHME